MDINKNLDDIFGENIPESSPSDKRIQDILNKPQPEPVEAEVAVVEPVEELSVTEEAVIEEAVVVEEQPVEVKPEPVVEETEEDVEESFDMEEYEEPVEIKEVEEEINEEVLSDDNIVRDDEGYLEEISDVTVVEDTEGDIKLKAKIYNGLFNTSIPEHLKDKSLLFGRSEIKTRVNVGENALASLKSFKRMGESIDVYLPVSNVAVRIYEFDNDTFIDDTLELIKSSYNEFLDSRSHRMVSANRRLIDKIKDNCEFLTGDSNTITPDFAFDSLSKHDIELVLLGTAALLTYVDNKSAKEVKDPKTGAVTSKKGTFKFSIPYECPKCGQKNELVLDLLEVLKQQYSKMTIEDVQKKIDEYDNNELFMDKLQKSIHNKKYAIRYKKTSKSQDLTSSIEVIIKDPSFGAFKRQEDDMYRYILSKHYAVLQPHTMEIPGYNTFSSTKKITMVMNKLMEESNADNQEDYLEFISDYTLANLNTFINKIVITTTVAGVDTTQSILFDEESSANKLEALSSLPHALVEKLVNNISKIAEKGSKPIEAKIVCGHCGNTVEETITSMEFFFTVIERVI